MTSGYNITELVQEAHVRWLKPGEVLFILQSFEEDQLTHEPPQKPSSGSLFLFNRKVLRFFRKDGHSWRRKKDGRTVGEAHERLKVGNAEALNCYYAHGEQNPNFQRRSYWMLNSAMEHIVLVHYRDITVCRHSDGSLSMSSLGSSSTLVQGSNSYASHLTRSAAAAVSEFSGPYESTSSPSSIEVSSVSVTHANGTSDLNQMEIMEGIDNLPNLEMGQALRRIEEQLSLDEDHLKDISAFYRGNENSYDSGLTVNEQTYSAAGAIQDGSNIYVSQQYSGDSGRLHQYQQQSEDQFTTAREQNLIWDDILKYNGSAPGDGGSQENYDYPPDKDAMFLVGSGRSPVEEQENCHSGDTRASNESCVLLPQDLEDFQFPAYTPARNMYESHTDIYSMMFDKRQTRMPLETDSSLTIAQEQKFTIREISPEWCYAAEPAKVFIIGTFTCDPTKCEWTCMFGGTEVPVEIIQEGVICCQAPPHLPGKVTLCITSGNRESSSEVREFEYRDKPSSRVQANLTEKESSRGSDELLLLVRFVQMLLSDQVCRKGESTRIDCPATSMTGEDSWAQVIEALLDGSLTSSSATDWVLEALLKDKLQQWLSSRLQDKNALPALSKKEQGIIHMISGLGFSWALSPILNSGVGVNFRDINGWTALHWAARFGREKMVAELIASGAFAGAVTDPRHQDPTGKTPASIASTFGHKGLAGYLSELAITTHLSSLTLQESELARNSADVEAERTVNSISMPNLVVNEDHLSLKDTLAAVRNATQAAARIQSAFRAHSFRKRQLKESAAYASGDEYGILPSEIEGLSAASRLTFRNTHNYNAALSIQKKYRGWKGRKDFLALRHKVVKIQAHVRGYQVRKNYKVICWAVGVVEKIVLRWRRKGVGLRGFRQELESLDESEDEDVMKAFRKQKVDDAVGEAVSSVISMVDSQPARKQYRRMLQIYREAKAERGDWEGEAASASQGDLANMEKDDNF